jgi:hypothetical protein
LNEERQCDAAGRERPLSLKWISEDLVACTQRVWAKELGREVPRDEAIEMLLNVKLMAEAFHLAEEEGDRK